MSTAEGSIGPYQRVPAAQAAAHLESATTSAALLTSTSSPALFAMVWLSAGILLSRQIWISPALLLTGTLLIFSVTLLAAGKALRVAWAPLACLFLLLGVVLSELQPLPDFERALSSLADSGGTHLVEGEIVRTTPVRLAQSSGPFFEERRPERSQSIDLRIRSVDGASVPGGVRGTIYAPAAQPFPVLGCGDVVTARTVMRLPERYRDPGVWDSTAWLRQQGIGAVGSFKAAELQVRSSSGFGSVFCRIHSLEEAGSQRLLDFASTQSKDSKLPTWLRLSGADAAMLSAMLLGDRTYLDRQTRIGFERTGSFHLLVVSGMHLAIFAGLIFAVARLLRLPSVATTAVTIACSLAYALLTGFGDPVRRSFWMVTIFLLARMLFRQRNSLNAIGFAGLCMLAADPQALFDASFQMTLLSVLVIAGIVVPIAERTFSPYLRATRRLSLIAIDGSFPPRVAQFRVSLRLLMTHLRPLLGRFARLLPWAVRLGFEFVELLLASCAIELAMSLPMATYFHRITALALPINILVVPLIGLALPAALLTFAAILISPSLAAAPAAVTAALLHLIDGIVRSAGGMQAGDLRIPAPGAAACVLVMALIAFAVWTARHSRFPVALSFAALGCALGCVLYPRPFLFHPGVMEVTAIDVGQGDSLLLVSPQGQTLLIDAGGPTGGADQPSTANFDIGEDVVSPVLWSRNLRRLDAVELTHAHSDHMGGMAAVLRSFRPKELWVGKNPDIPAYDALLEEARSLGIEVRRFSAGDSFDFGGAHIDVLSPGRGYLPGREALNDDSLVLHAAFGATSVLLEGDAQSKSEAQMLKAESGVDRAGDRAANLGADLLKIGHHGSRSSSTSPFLAAVHPKYALISVGHRNPYGHPRIEVLDRLQQEGVRTFRTDTLGATSFYLDGRSVSAHPLAEDEASGGSIW